MTTKTGQFSRVIGVERRESDGHMFLSLEDGRRVEVDPVSPTMLVAGRSDTVGELFYRQSEVKWE